MLKSIKQKIEDKIVKKFFERILLGSRKDQRIRELWNMLSKVDATLMTYGNMADYEANPDWVKPTWLRNGEYYSMEERLEDIRRDSRQIMKLNEEIKKVLFKDSNIAST